MTTDRTAYLVLASLTTPGNRELGVRILALATLAAATRERANGLDRVLLTPTRPALGFGLPVAGKPSWSLTPFGFPGHDGSLGYAGPAAGVASAYVTDGLRISLPIRG
ncbi:hypothetical protein [Dactylosporangium sp. CA-139066]|uniref:hypothetical protein n=1 Tax=Dactylosporangium sp. CA-139066 TaxID=3239930 RepID=UPI003D8F859D